MNKVIQARLPCPKCPSSDAFHRYGDGHGYCFSCSYYEGNGKEDLLYTYEYLPLRGISKRALEFYDAKTKIDTEGKPISIGFKYPTGPYKVRSLETKDFWWEPAADKGGLYGRDHFTAGASKNITITEGELDAISFYDVLGTPVVSVRSASSALRDATLDRSWLNSFERIYLAFDSDAAGREATRAVARLFDYNKILVVDFDRRKDANEYLQAGEVNELKAIWQNAKRYLPKEIKSSLEDFKKSVTDKPKQGVDYPFPGLTEMTYGLRTGETVLFTAQEKVGKTEIMHFIEHHLLTRTKDNVGAIFIEEPETRHLRALAGIQIKKPVHLPDCDCPTDSVVAAIEQVVQTDDRLHLYAHFGSDDPEILLDHIRFLVSARSCRWILLDHLTMVVSGIRDEKDERRTLDYISTRLEMMVKELDFGLIMVCHENDYGQSRGSRMPTKVADITIQATRNLQEVDPIKRNTISLNVKYNRFCSRTGPAGQYAFDEATYSYKEVEDVNFNSSRNTSDNYFEAD